MSARRRRVTECGASPPLLAAAALVVAADDHRPRARRVGGVPNPQSPDKSIPPLSGADLFKKFDTDAKIARVIRSGSVIGPRAETLRTG